MWQVNTLKPMNKEAQKVIKSVFEANKDQDAFVATSDRQCFYTENQALSHARTLKDDSIVAVTRGQFGDDDDVADKAAADKAVADKAAADKAEVDKAAADKAEADKAEAVKAVDGKGADKAPVPIKKTGGK